MKKIIFIILLLQLFIFGNSINIAVAANVSYAIPTLKKEFNKKYPNIKVNITLGSSGKLTAQIRNYAPYDIFMSADMKYPNLLYKINMAITKPIIYAKGSLAILSNKKQDFSKGLNIVLNKEIKRIAIANPKTAPYGIATAEVLKNAGLYSKLKKKFIYGESISQTVSYTITATDIGFIAKSSLYSPTMNKFKKGIHWIDIDRKFYNPISQGVVILKHSKNNIKETKLFYDFILSEKGKEIFRKFGYFI